MLYRTLTEAAEALLMATSYTDVYGRNVGLTYKAILFKLRHDFPKSRTSLGSLRKIAYALNGSKQRMPVRRRSPRVLARDYARALLVAVDPKTGTGYKLRTISRKVKQKFPEHAYIPERQLNGIAMYLAPKFKLPARPEA